MSKTIGVSGKGGMGKTTLTGLIIRELLRRKESPILAVDADPNANLNETIGVQVERTVGSTLAEFFNDKMSLPAGMTKETYMEIKLNEILIEDKGLDLLVMGRGEGQGCYCYPNLMVKKFIEELSCNYKYVVMDNQAGMEHLSRRTTDNMDVLFVVTNPTVKGVRTARRIYDLIEELELTVSKTPLVINGVDGEISSEVAEELSREGLTPDWTVPRDAMLPQFDLDRRPLTELSDDSPAVQAVSQIVDDVLGG
jgi:CO dehydrogenase maturation factor